MTKSDTVKLSRTEAVATVSLCRPAARNALNQELLDALHARLTEIANDGSIRVVILRGEGQQAFCAGADLGELLARADIDARRAFFGRLADIFKLLHGIPKPVISLVHGFALAGGCGLACSGDLVYAADSAQFGLPEIKIGIMPLVVLAPLVPLIGAHAASDLVLRGELITAARAAEIGLVTRVIAAADLDREADAVAAELAGRSADALRIGTRAIRSIAAPQYAATLDTMVEQIATLSLGADAERGMRAFFERRK